MQFRSVDHEVDHILGHTSVVLPMCVVDAQFCPVDTRSCYRRLHCCFSVCVGGGHVQLKVADLVVVDLSQRSGFFWLEQSGSIIGPPDCWVQGAGAAAGGWACCPANASQPKSWPDREDGLAVGCGQPPHGAGGGSRDELG